MLKRFGVVLSFGVMLLLCVCAYYFLSYTFLFGLFLPDQRCKLIDYPRGQLIIGKFTGEYGIPSHTLMTEDSLDSVLAFYDQSLPVQTTNSTDIIKFRAWNKKMLTSSRYLYECFAEDLTGTIETQCIYVSRDNERTQIETLSFTAEFFQVCPEKRVD